jgi:guanylate kinase
MNNSKVIIITAPSGSGKSTLIKILMKALPELAFSISACTRSPRNNEINGIDYHFISTTQFEQHIAQDDFIEWEMVYAGKYYGTLKSEFERIWHNTKIPLVDIDVKGALNVQKQYQHNSISIFIKAPSIEELERRLRNRNTDSEENIIERISKVAEETNHAEEFDHIIVNDNLEKASEELITIVRAFIR